MSFLYQFVSFSPEHSTNVIRTCLPWLDVLVLLLMLLLLLLLLLTLLTLLMLVLLVTLLLLMLPLLLMLVLLMLPLLRLLPLLMLLTLLLTLGAVDAGAAVTCSGSVSRLFTQATGTSGMLFRSCVRSCTRAHGTRRTFGRNGRSPEERVSWSTRRI